MSFNITEATSNYARNSCQTQYAPIATGTLKYTSACLPTNATSAAGIRCLSIPQAKIPSNADCQYLIQGKWENPIGKRQQDTRYFCYTLCQNLKSGSAIKSSNAAVATATPSQSAGNAGLTLYPNFSLIAFFALVFFMFMFFKPKH